MPHQRSRRSKSRPEPPLAQLKAFVIMPFNLLSDQVFETLIRPSLAKAGYQVERADTSLHQRAIMQNIVAGIEGADLVVADLTGRNANVFYELGIAHALRKPVLMIAQSTQDIPFDVNAYPVHIYPLELERPARLRDTLTAKLRPVLNGARRGEVVFANPFTDFATLESSEATEPSGGLLDLFAAATRDLPEYTKLLKEGTELMGDLGAKQQTINKRAGQAREGEEIKHALAMAADSATLWDEYATKFESVVQRAIPLTDSIERGTLAAVRLSSLGGNEEEAEGLKASVRTMAASAAGSATMMVSFAGTVRGLSELSGSLRRPGDRLAAVMESLGAQMGRIGALPDLMGDAHA